MTYIEPRLGALAFRISDWPETPTVCATPGVSRASVSIRAMTRCGPLHRGRVGQLHVEQQIALVLLRDEAGGRADELPVGQAQQPAVEQQHDHADPQHAADDPAVDRRSSGRTAG